MPEKWFARLKRRVLRNLFCRFGWHYRSWIIGDYEPYGPMGWCPTCQSKIKWRYKTEWEKWRAR